MQGSDISSQRVFITPLRVRIGVACLMLLDAALFMWKHFLGFEWVPWLFLGFYWLAYCPRHKGEPLSVYLKKPQVIVSIVLLVGALLGFGHNLSVLYAKHYR